MPDAPAVHTRSLPEAPPWVPREGEYCRREFTGLGVERSMSEGSEVEDRTTVTINTAQEDRHGTQIEPGGARLEEYARNPVVLINHNPNLLACTSTVRLAERNGAQVLEAMHTDEDWDHEDDLVERWFTKLKRGILRAASIGFVVHGRERELIDPEGDPYDWKNIRVRITDWSLLEWSYVTVPSNSGALVTARSLSPGFSAPGFGYPVGYPVDERAVLTEAEVLAAAAEADAHLPVRQPDPAIIARAAAQAAGATVLAVREAVNESVLRALGRA